jgi:hypothetical protein
VGWLGSILILWPFPWDNNYLDENEATIREIVALRARGEGLTLSENEISKIAQQDINTQKRALWYEWLLRIVTVLSALLSAALYLLRANSRWLACLAVTSFVYLGLWMRPALGVNSFLRPLVAHGSAVLKHGSYSQILEFVFLDVSLPSLHVFTIAFLAWVFVRTSNARNASS